MLLDSAHFATSWAKMCNECYNMGLTNLRTEGYVIACDTCDSKKCKIPVLGAHAARTLHAREGDRYTRIRQLSLIGEIGDCIAVKNTSVLQNKNSILVLQKNFSSLFCVFFTHQGNI